MRKIIPWLITLISCSLVTGALATVKYQQITEAIAFGADYVRVGSGLFGARLPRASEA